MTGITIQGLERTRAVGKIQSRLVIAVDLFIVAGALGATAWITRDAYAVVLVALGMLALIGLSYAYLAADLWFDLIRADRREKRIERAREAERASKTEALRIGHECLQEKVNLAGSVCTGGLPERFTPTPLPKKALLADVLRAEQAEATKDEEEPLFPDEDEDWDFDEVEPVFSDGIEAIDNGSEGAAK